MGQERASAFAQCRADIPGLLLLSCLLGVQDKRKEVLVIRLTGKWVTVFGSTCCGPGLGLAKGTVAPALPGCSISGVV